MLLRGAHGANVNVASRKIPAGRKNNIPLSSDASQVLYPRGRDIARLDPSKNSTKDAFSLRIIVPFNLFDSIPHNHLSS